MINIWFDLKTFIDENLVDLFKMNNNLFPSSYTHMSGIDLTIVTHELHVNPNVK